MTLLPQSSNLGVVRVCKAVARVVEERKRFVVFSGSFVSAMQLAPNLESESAEVSADRSRVGVASFQLPAFDKPVANHPLNARVGWSDPQGEDVAGLVVQVACETLKLGCQTQDQCLVEGSGSPATSASRSSHELVGIQQIVEMLSALSLPAREGCGCHLPTVPYGLVVRLSRTTCSERGARLRF